jgi:hypothetical protein
VSWKPALRRESQLFGGTAGLRDGMVLAKRLAKDLSSLTLFLAARYNRRFCGSIT